MLFNRLNIFLLGLPILLLSTDVHAAPNPAPTGRICRPPQFSCGDDCCFPGSDQCVNDVCTEPPPPPPCKIPCGAKCCIHGTDPSFPDWGRQYCADASKDLCCDTGKASCNGKCCDFGLVCRSISAFEHSFLACLHPIYTKEQCRANGQGDPCLSDVTCSSGRCSSGCCFIKPR